MHIKVALTEDIVNQCLEMHYGIQPAGKKIKKRLIWIPLFLVAIGAYLIFDEMKQPVPGQNLYMGFLYIGFAIAYYFFMRNRLVKAGKRLLKHLGPNAVFTVDVEGNELKTTTTTGTNINTWNAFTGALIGKGNVLLYQSNNTFTMFHHSFFNNDDFNVFKTKVREQVHPVIEV